MNLEALKAENEALKLQNLLLKTELDNLKKMIFGSSSERRRYHEDVNQSSLFDPQNDLENLHQADQSEAIIQVVKKPKKKKRKTPKRVIFPANLPRETQIINPENLNEEKAVKIGEDVTEILAYKPSEIYIKQIIRPRWAEKSDDISVENQVMQAPIPPRLIPKGIVDESLLSHIIVEKMMHHTPVYRLSKKLRQQGIDFIKQKNMHNWIHTSAQALMPLCHLLKEELLASGYLQVDETTLKVLESKKASGAHTGYIWVTNNPHIKITFYFYAPTRSGEAAFDLLEEYSHGILQADGYSVYENIVQNNPTITLIYCMAHARRKFIEANNNDPPLANYALDKIGLLYKIEKQAREENLTFEQRQQLRQEHALPILDELQTWLEEKSLDMSILPQSPIGKAIAYSLKRWKGLCAYAYDGMLEIDNNLVENTIRPIALGRKNYLFAATHESAQNLACLYTIICTANNHGLAAKPYLEWLLRKSCTEKIDQNALEWLPHKLTDKIKNQFLIKKDGV